MTVAIGDIQGCFDCLTRMLRQIPEGERLWLCGDLVNRGPQSLATLRWVHAHRDRIVTVLGNHDLHLLATVAGARRPGKSDTLSDILEAPDRDVLIDWLRRQPLAHLEGRHLLVHAGLLPQWSASQALALAGEVHRVLAGDGWQSFLHEMYGNRPDQWSDDLTGIDRLRVIVNALTRLRFCSAQGRMDLVSTAPPDQPPEGCLPWFDVPGRTSADVTVVFGHWSSLGLLDRPNLLGLDTGCVWGRQLTGVRIEDRALFQVGCPAAGGSSSD